MHIPACDATAQLTVLPFADALKQALVPVPDYDVAQWLYVPNFYAEYRYILGTRGEHPLICVGVNPSTAAPNALDNTLKSVERIARANGYDSFLMFNVYAQRATRPGDLERTLNPVLHAENMAAFRYALEQTRRGHPTIWAAWGNLIEMRPYLPACVRDMLAVGETLGAKWFTAGKRSVKGHPHHPLYLRRDSPLEPFEVTRYLDEVLGAL